MKHLEQETSVVGWQPSMEAVMKSVSPECPTAICQKQGHAGNGFVTQVIPKMKQLKRAAFTNP